MTSTSRRPGRSRPRSPSSSPSPAKKLYGSSTSRRPAWGYVNWMMRYISAGTRTVLLRPVDGQAADQQPGGHPGDQGARRVDGVDVLQRAVAVLADGVCDDGRGQAAMGSFFSNCDEVHRHGERATTRKYGKYLRTRSRPAAWSMGSWSAAPVIYFNNQFASMRSRTAGQSRSLVPGAAVTELVGTSSPGSRATRLATSTRTATSALNDPLVRASLQAVRVRRSSRSSSRGRLHDRRVVGRAAVHRRRSIPTCRRRSPSR